MPLRLFPQSGDGRVTGRLSLHHAWLERAAYLLPIDKSPSKTKARSPLCASPDGAPLSSQLDDAVLANADAGAFRHPAVNRGVRPPAEGAESSMWQRASSLLLCEDLFAEPEARLTNRSPGSARNSGLGFNVFPAAE